MRPSSETARLDQESLVLTPLAPDPARAARTRERCRVALSSRARRRARREEAIARAVDAVAPLLVISGGLFYVATLIANALTLRPLLP